MRGPAVLDECALGRVVPELRGGWRFGGMGSMAPLGPAYFAASDMPDHPTKQTRLSRDLEREQDKRR
jgi:hypothetical protein